MSVRATGSLIADLVVVSGIPNSPKMVVSSVDADKREVTTVWFSNSGDAQRATFPAQALDRVEPPSSAAAKKSVPAKAKKH